MDSKPKETKRTRTYVEKVFKKIQEQPDITDILILNRSNNPIKTTMERSASIEFAGYYGALLQKARLGVQTMDSTDELQMLRVRTSLNEVLITPDDKITVIVVQNAQELKGK